MQWTLFQNVHVSHHSKLWEQTDWVNIWLLYSSASLVESTLLPGSANARMNVIYDIDVDAGIEGFLSTSMMAFAMPQGTVMLLEKRLDLTDILVGKDI